ncbi:MAG: threonine/serine exporter family protein [Eubacteriales bacterium]|nr:threonine/serine exporter family protein [Eubacteriales bacterium]
MNAFYQLIWAFLGTFAFCLYFNLKNERLFIASLMGLGTWAIYLFVMELTGNVFVSSFLATFIMGVVSEVLARVYKTPSMVFYIPSIIPIIPGGSLYYLMQAVVQSDRVQMSYYAYMLIWTILGMGVGVSLIQVIMTVRKNIRG